uniref:Uncharacterized protein n=1 Tax=Arundo donax TaxID=35708 RepID=A0A0A9D0Q0_ARUDO
MPRISCLLQHSHLNQLKHQLVHFSTHRASLRRPWIYVLQDFYELLNT